MTLETCDDYFFIWSCILVLSCVKNQVEGESILQWPLYVITLYLFLGGALGLKHVKIKQSHNVFVYYGRT
jgi:hypothetical protein